MERVADAGAVAVAWSGGKDSACAYAWARQQKRRVCCLVSALDETADEVEFHGIAPSVLDAQAAAIGVTLLTRSHTPAKARQAWLELLESARLLGARACVFGDHFSSGSRRAFYEGLCAEAGLDLLTPFVAEPSGRALRMVVEAGVESVIIACDPELMTGALLGETIDGELIRRLEEQDDVDPAGNHGEYHSLAVDAPFFTKRLMIDAKESARRGRYLILQIDGVEAVEKLPSWQTGDK